MLLWCFHSMQVPKGHVWLQGDNAYNSTDSRHYGPVPYALIQGKVFYRVRSTLQTYSPILWLIVHVCRWLFLRSFELSQIKNVTLSAHTSSLFPIWSILQIAITLCKLGLNTVETSFLLCMVVNGRGVPIICNGKFRGLNMWFVLQIWPPEGWGPVLNQPP